jgi:signal transduction histidine kinase
MTSDDEGELKPDGRGILHPEGMRAARQMASGLVHEVNNLLGIIIGNAHLARKASTDAAAVERYVREIRSAAEEGRELMRGLGLLANGGGGAQSRLLSLNDLVRTAVSGIDLRTELDLSQQDPTVQVDIWSAQGALTALLGFFAESASVSSVRVATRIAGRAVALTLEDDGASPSDAELQLLFSPFAKADRRPKTGLRLAQVADFASRTGGHVVASRSEPHGLRIVVTLPIAPREGQETVQV